MSSEPAAGEEMSRESSGGEVSTPLPPPTRRPQIGMCVRLARPIHRNRIGLAESAGRHRTDGDRSSARGRVPPRRCVARQTVRMASQGVVREWHDEEGWGVIDSEATPGGCWAHYSAVLVAGYRRLEEAQVVSFTFEVAEQDGYSFRVVEAWPSEEAPVPADGAGESWSPAMRSTLHVSYDRRVTAAASASGFLWNVRCRVVRTGVRLP
jgi:cold shock protein